MAIERKTIKFEVKEINEEEGTFIGYGSAFRKTPDSYGDIVDSGAFKKTIKEGKGRIVHLFNHNVNEPIGKPDELSEDETGLLVKGRLSLGVQRAREVLALMKDGVLTQMSIGYQTIKEEMIDGVRHLKEIKLYDVSPVVFAADNEALITSVKEMEFKPYPNEHACRLRNPDDFQEGSFRRTTRVSDSKEYSVIMGKLNGEDTLTEQAYRYDQEVWGETAAKSHCKDHDGTFEAAEKAGRVLSASNISKVRAALEALQNLLESATIEEEGGKAALNEETIELEAVISSLQAENEGFDMKKAEARIENLLQQLRDGK